MIVLINIIILKKIMSCSIVIVQYGDWKQAMNGFHHRRIPLYHITDKLVCNNLKLNHNIITTYIYTRYQ